MSNKPNINALSMSDMAIVETLGSFIKHHRLEQNKTQHQLASEAGINRSTLIEFEKGQRSSMITFIQLLRALGLLSLLQPFQVQPQFSPIQLAKLEHAKRKRASTTKKHHKTPKSNW